MQTVISLAPLVICIITAIMTRKGAAPLTDSTKQGLKIANLVGLGLDVISLIWTIIAGIYSIIIFAQISSLSRGMAGAEYVGFSIVWAIIWIIICIAFLAAVGVWHYYLLEKKLGGFKNAFKFSNTAAPAPEPPVIKVEESETDKEEKDNIV